MSDTKTAFEEARKNEVARMAELAAARHEVKTKQAARAELVEAAARGSTIAPRDLLGADEAVREAEAAAELAERVHSAAVTFKHRAEIDVWHAEAAALDAERDAAESALAEIDAKIDPALAVLREIAAAHDEAQCRVYAAKAEIREFNCTVQRQQRSTTNPEHARLDPGERPTTRNGAGIPAFGTPLPNPAKLDVAIYGGRFGNRPPAVGAW